jgi:GT2 family glycosyltransferase
MNGLSIVTLVKNRAEHLRELVEGLSRSEYPPSELIIVSMDDLPYAQPPTPFPIHVLRIATDGLPLAKARNTGAAAARCDHLLFLDVDCIPMRGLTGAILPALMAHDALICADIRYLAADQTKNGWTEEQLLVISQSHPVRQFPSSGLRVEPNSGLFWSLAFGVRRARFMSLGGFDERFVGYGAEDTDFGFRARAAQIPLLFLGGPGAFHQYHDVFDPPLQHFQDIVRNARTFHQKWRIWPMDGWLRAFEAMGLIALSDQHLQLLRHPGASEIHAARKPRTVRF